MTRTMSKRKMNNFEASGNSRNSLMTWSHMDARLANQYLLFAPLLLSRRKVSSKEIQEDCSASSLRAGCQGVRSGVSQGWRAEAGRVPRNEVICVQESALNLDRVFGGNSCREPGLQFEAVRRPGDALRRGQRKAATDETARRRRGERSRFI